MIVRLSLEQLLAEWGYRPICAATGEEALKIAARADVDFDAVLTDYRLGAGMNGVETAVRIEQAKGRPLPKLVMTGDTGADALAAIGASGCRLLHKPVDPEDLRFNLTQMLEL